MRLLLTNYVLILGWVLAMIVIMAAGLSIFAWLLNVFTGEINVWKEIKRKNSAMAIVMGATFLAVGLIVGLICK